MWQDVFLATKVRAARTVGIDATTAERHASYQHCTGDLLTEVVAEPRSSGNGWSFLFIVYGRRWRSESSAGAAPGVRVSAAR